MEAIAEKMTEGIEIWIAGFSLGIGAALLVFKIFFPFQLAKQALSEI